MQDILFDCQVEIIIVKFFFFREREVKFFNSHVMIMKGFREKLCQRRKNGKEKVL